MARKNRAEEHENHERWLVSYADFITLLFAFFVVMYSISSVNEGKYRVLSDSMVAAFRDPARSLEPVQTGVLVREPMQSDTPMGSREPIVESIKMP
jgi:chemotaxis protein MotB